MVGTTSGGWAGSEPLLPIGPSLPSGTTSPPSPWWIPMASKAGRTRCGAQSWTSLCAEVRGPDDVGRVRTATDNGGVAGFAARGLLVAGDAGGRPATPAACSPGLRRPHRRLGAGSGPTRTQAGGRRHRDQRLTGDRTRSWASSSASSFGDSLLKLVDAGIVARGSLVAARGLGHQRLPRVSGTLCGLDAEDVREARPGSGFPRPWLSAT